MLHEEYQISHFPLLLSLPLLFATFSSCVHGTCQIYVDKSDSTLDKQEREHMKEREQQDQLMRIN